jgi:hypothetical protein
VQRWNAGGVDHEAHSCWSPIPLARQPALAEVASIAAHDTQGMPGPAHPDC